MDEDLSEWELAHLGCIFLGEVDDVRRTELIARVKDPFGHDSGSKRILYLGGPNNGWLVTGRFAESMLSMYANGGQPQVGQRVHDSPRYYVELMQAGLDGGAIKRLGLRLEPVVYQLESLDDPIIVRFLGWYSELHDEHGNHTEPPSTGNCEPAATD
jgi:hypothetical protein